MFNKLFSTSAITLPKIINGISNTLSITNKALPLIKQSGPVFNNIKKAFNTIKSTTPPKTKITTNSDKKTINIDNNKKETSSTLVFFQ